MAELVDRSEEIVKGSGWFCASVGHVGDGMFYSSLNTHVLNLSAVTALRRSKCCFLGNVHTAIVCPLDAKPAAEALLAQIQRLALELEGTITGEHGVGLKLRDLLVEEVGQTGVDAMRRIKMALDPSGILNPDKVIRLDANI